MLKSYHNDDLCDATRKMPPNHSLEQTRDSAGFA
jgi:hypothetical protein